MHKPEQPIEVLSTVYIWYHFQVAIFQFDEYRGSVMDSEILKRDAQNIVSPARRLLLQMHVINYTRFIREKRIYWKIMRSIGAASPTAPLPWIHHCMGFGLHPFFTALLCFVRPTAVRAISTDIICQAIVQHCRISDLELTATCCVKLRLSLSLSLSTFKSRLKTSVFYRFLITMLRTCSASASVAA